MTEILKVIDNYNVIEYDKTNIFVLENIIDDKLCLEFIDFINELPLKKLHYLDDINNVKCYSYISDALFNDEYYNNFYRFSIDDILYNKLLENVNKKKSIYSNKINGIDKTKTQNIITNINKKIEIANSIMTKLCSLTLDYNTGYTFRKIYGETRSHIDGITKIYNSNVTFIKENNSGDYRMIRKLSIIFSLNDDYDGGIFNFPYQNVSIKLKKGSLLLFPPYWTHPHNCTELENNTYRYTISTWVCDKI